MPLIRDLSNEEKFKVTCAPETLNGNPADLDGPLEAEVLSGSVTWEPDPGDKFSLWVVSGQNAGPYSLRVFGDADLGEGRVILEDSVSGNISGAMAANLGMTASPNEPK